MALNARKSFLDSRQADGLDFSRETGGVVFNNREQLSPWPGSIPSCAGYECLVPIGEESQLLGKTLAPGPAPVPPTSFGVGSPSGRTVFELGW